MLRSAAFGLAAVLAVEVFAIRFGWIREWWPAAPQLLITVINPGTVLTAIYGAYSVWLVRRYDSTRAGALGLFTCFLCGFLVLTIVGTYFRGPNWDFYWSPVAVAGALMMNRWSDCPRRRAHRRALRGILRAGLIR